MPHPDSPLHYLVLDDKKKCCINKIWTNTYNWIAIHRHLIQWIQRIQTKQKSNIYTHTKKNIASSELEMVIRMEEREIEKRWDYYICYVCHLAVTEVDELNMTKQIDASRTNSFFIDYTFTYRRQNSLMIQFFECFILLSSLWLSHGVFFRPLHCGRPNFF